MVRYPEGDDMALLLVFSLVTVAAICLMFLVAILEQAYEETQHRLDTKDPRYVPVAELAPPSYTAAISMQQALSEARSVASLQQNVSPQTPNPNQGPKKFVGSRYMDQEGRPSQRRVDMAARKGPAWMNSGLRHG